MYHIQEIKINEDLAYLCGVLAGDGNITIRHHKYDYAIKCVGNPLDEQEFYFQVIAPMFRKVFGVIIKPKFHDSNTTFGFRISSKVIVSFLVHEMRLPSGKKYDALHIPNAFLTNEKLTKAFVRGVFDTDGCMSFKKRNKWKKDYPVISMSSKSKVFVEEITSFLNAHGFKTITLYDYKVIDPRLENGFSIINTVSLNGRYNFSLWQRYMKFASPKHLEKIRKNSGEWI